ncbi:MULTISPECIES: ABC transporter permease [Aeromicrobium]|uniref:ABC transporter permease n=1 Tax=Aeromicrobium TaxID=2040 RepID=UPI0006FB3455|nr:MULTISPECIES: ABC transporter permease [Aeromicrobium]KQX74014.1 ribose ABC transporter permease [Aeromicrobium sp. Root472D3]MBD8608813.1 ABC transporter permease [Aeromicrobium sp. CFBP 8757]MCL8252934.1 ABC transporter permease [Aeromicrobium fastidiosum]
MTTTDPVKTTATPKASRRTTKRPAEPERFALLGVWAVLFLVFSLIVPETFPTTANISNMLGSQAVLLVLALGLIVPLRAGDYDLSVASTLNLSAVVVAVLNVNQGWNIWAAVIAAILVSMVVGVVNGFIITRFDIDPFIVTLGVGTVVQGLIYQISNSVTITGVDRKLSDTMLTQPFLAIPVDFYYAIALCVLVWYVFDHTAFGQRLLFAGQSRDVARLNGVNVSGLRWVSMIISAGVAGVAGVIYAGTTASADPTSGAAFLLPAFAACFLGSTVLKIGRFNPWGTLIAVYFLVTGITGLQLMGAQQYVQQLFYGGALVVAVIMSKLVKTRGERRRQAEVRPDVPA